MNEAIIAAIAAGVGSVITIVGRIIVDIIKARKEPDQSDLELKDELEREKDKNDTAIQTFTEVVEELKSDVKEIKGRLETMNQRIEDYRTETREVNKAEIRHTITQIYFEHCDEKKLDLRTKEDLCSLYESYASIGGNSFAHKLYNEMMAWEVK